MSTNMVRVWNRNRFDHKEPFKGKDLVIPAGGCIEMDYDEAVHFRGQFFSPKYGKDMIQKPESYKWIEIDEDDKKAIYESRMLPGESSEKEKVFICHMCRKEFRTSNGLLKHVKEKHLSDMADKEARDELLDNEDLE